MGKINKILFLVFLLVLAFCLYDIGANVLPRFSKVISIGPGALHVRQVNVPVSSAPKPLDYYASAISGKNLFKAQTIDSTSGQSVSTEQQLLNTRLSDAMQGLALKGVIAGNPAQAVIEETKTGKTYFVVKNDRIGDIIIEDISTNRVRLRCLDQVVDLTL